MIKENSTGAAVSVPTNCYSPYHPCLSWRAVLAGAVAALGLHLLLSLIASGLGLAVFDPTGDLHPAKNFGRGAAIGWSLCALVSLFFGGWIAGRFNGGNKLTGGLHGFLVWSVAMIATFGLIVLGGGMALGGMAKVVGVGMKGAGKAAAGAGDLAKESLQRNQDQIKSFLDEAMASRGTNASSNQTIRAKREISFAITHSFAPGSLSSGTNAVSQENRAALVKALTENEGMSEADANKLIDDWSQSYNKLKAELDEAKATAEKKARETADVAARKLSKAAFCSFIAFWIGAMLASFGGVLGARSAYTEVVLVRESTVVKGTV